jgi:hypothetical protein
MGMFASKATQSNDEDLFVVMILVIRGMYLPPVQIFARRAHFTGEKNYNFCFFNEKLIVVWDYAEV